MPHAATQTTRLRPARANAHSGLCAASSSAHTDNASGIEKTTIPTIATRTATG